MIIDPPSPFAPLTAWIRFRDEMRKLARQGDARAQVAAHLKEAERMVAEKRSAN